MASDFVERTLGPWSSHPEGLRKQRFLLLFLGLLPIIAVALACVLIYTESFEPVPVKQAAPAAQTPGTAPAPAPKAAPASAPKAAPASAPQAAPASAPKAAPASAPKADSEWKHLQEFVKNYTEQIGLLTCAFFFSLGFLFNLSVLYLASFTIGSRKEIKGKDDLLFPLWLWAVLCFFWLLPWGLSLLDSALLQKLAFIPEGKVERLKVVLNLLTVAPFVCVLTWILCARREELKENEKLVRRRWLLVAALICGGLLCVSFFIPWKRPVIWGVLLPAALVFLTLWWFWRKKVSAEGEKKAEAGEKDEAEAEEPELPEQAQYIIDHLPEEGIEYGGDGKKEPIKEFSPRIPNDESAKPLIALMNGKVPTKDQSDFLHKFISLYEETLTNFFEQGTPNSEQLLPDIILHGQEGSGRTEALCAAAVYAAVVRGQNVLYIVQDGLYASSLAEKMKVRLRDFGVDCYYTADYLMPNFVDGWLVSSTRAAKSSGTTGLEAADSEMNEDEPELPPNILFATPEQIESNFFCNEHLNDARKREALRNILLSYSTILVDDLFEMPIPLQAHLTFILDKFRLLQASEYVMGQFVVATARLQDPYGIDSLAERLFGLTQFKRTRNAVMLRPRQCEPFWCGTLWIDPDKLGGSQALENAARKLLDICTEKNYNTLFYSKGISREEAKELESAYEKGAVSVSAHLYQLNVEKMPFDTILYLSLTSGHAAAALRLSLPDDKAGTPVFFRIALRNEAEKMEMDQFALLPNETAISLRAFHLRSVLPFLPPLTPISASVWSHFGISLTHPCCRDAEIAKRPEGLSVEWYYDYYVETERYGDNVIWPYLVLASKPAGSKNAGREINFNILPNTKDTVCRDRQPDDLRGETLCFVAGKQETKDGAPSQIAVWRTHGTRLGVTDLAHSDLLTLVTENDQFSFGGFCDKTSEDADYAMAISAQPRRGLSNDVPVRRLSWELPEGGFCLGPDFNCSPEMASFLLRFGDSFTNPVFAGFEGLMDPLGKEGYSIDDSKGKYAYDAFMSCLVLLPEEDCKDKVSVCRSLSGSWSTEASSGFSSPLTHAFSIALRNRMAGLSFFAMTPVFLIEGRDGSFGRLLLWLLEPYNSGRTVYPLLAKLLRRSPEFKKVLLEDVRELLLPDDNEYVTLEALRSQSQMAFSGEKKLSKANWEYEIQRGLETISLLLDSEKLEQDGAVRKERNKKLEEDRKKCRQELIDPSLRSEENKDRYRNFTDSVRADLMAYKKVIDLSFCAEYGWSPARVNEYFDDFLWNSPEIFFVAKSYHYTYSLKPDGSLASFFITNLLYDQEVLEKGYHAARRELEQAAAAALEQLKPDSSSVEKALKLHDHIVRICEYDQKACDEKDLSPRARTAYSVLVRKSHTAVCEGYTMAYRYLLKRVGIQSEEVISKKMNHCWNYVNLDGKWYHVDVTWDDPVYRGGKPKNAGISHEYFLLSDEKIRSREHHDWSVRGLPPADDTKFDDKDWSTC